MHLDQKEKIDGKQLFRFNFNKFKNRVQKLLHAIIQRFEARNSPSQYINAIYNRIYVSE